MKPAPFEYHAPRSVSEATELLSGLEEAKILAGGQSLIPILALRLTRFDHLVDLGRIDSLKGIVRTDGIVTVGAMTTHAEVGESEAIAVGVPLAARATPLIGHFQIRNRGTLGGSVAHGDPSAEYPAVAVALDANIVLEGPSGERRVAATDFFLATFTTSMAEDEILTAVEFPVWGTGSGFAAEEVARRHGDFALVGAMAGVQVDGSRIKKAAIALFGVGGTPYRASAAEDSMIGSSTDSVDLTGIGRLAAADLDPPSDVHASGAYRREVGAVVVERALARAIKEAFANA
jgi:aerobic carbon-monoxide dehydrogenase medium subunit